MEQSKKRRYRRGKNRCRICGMRLSDPGGPFEKGHDHLIQKIWTKKLYDSVIPQGIIATLFFAKNNSSSKG